MRAARAAVISIVIAIWALGARAASLTPEEAASHAGETATVCGIVASAHYARRARSQPTFLDLGKAYPNQNFTAVIFGSDRAKFGTAETALVAKRICVTGKIRRYRGRPEIILRDPSQLTR
jgi:DNA/RNA endonuclease YhcR with UshA esterase domain